jgi:hypothetical protein
MRSLCAEPSYPEPLPQLTGNLVADGVARHRNSASFTSAVYHGLNDGLAPQSEPYLPSRPNQCCANDPRVIPQFGASELDGATGNGQ